jgi:hypothetical protein
VIDLRVGQYHAIDFLRIDRRWIPIAQAKLLQSLEQPAVDSEPACSRPIPSISSR